MYGQQQLARNNQVQAARARLAQRQIPGGAQQANMAGCGGAQPVIGGRPLGVVDTGFHLAPPLPPGSLYGGGVVRQDWAPCSVIVQADAGQDTVVQLATRGNSNFFIGGVSTCNNCFEIILKELNTGSLNVNLLPCGSVEAAIFNTDDCWCPFDIGCINTNAPLEIVFAPFGTPSVLPFLNMTFWGTADRGFADCGYPYGLPGLPYGGTPAWPGPGFVGGYPNPGGGDYGPGGYPAGYGPGGPGAPGGGMPAM